MIKKLPYWVVPDSLPAFYETEGATAIQMVAKLYGKVQEMIEDYNRFVDQVNTEIDNFEKGITKNFEDFKTCVMKLMNDYIETIDTKINMQDQSIAAKFDEQDTKIEDAINYMKNNIVATTTNIINQAILDGTITVGVSYDSENEELTIFTTEGSV